MTSASAAILVLFDSAISSAIVIPFAFEIIRMTGSTVGCVLRIGPRKITVYAIAVAAATSWISSMITRVVPTGTMAEDVWRPAVC